MCFSGLDWIGLVLVWFGWLIGFYVQRDVMVMYGWNGMMEEMGIGRLSAAWLLWDEWFWRFGGHSLKRCACLVGLAAGSR